MLKFILISIVCLSSYICAEPWIAYGTIILPKYTNIDNPPTSTNGLIGENSFPYTVPEGKQLTITYMQVEGPAADYFSNSSQFGMNLFIGEAPNTNEKGVLSCTTIGGSNQCHGMNLIIPSGKIVGIRCMNNTSIEWANGFCVQGILEEAP